MLDSGKRVKKNQKIPNETSLYLRNIFMAVIRITAKRIRIDDDYTGLSGSLLDDHLFNGASINFPLIRTGPTANTPDKHFFRKGQRVVVKTSVITLQYYNFLSNVSNEMGQTLSPLSFQVPALSLMSGGALGGWGCYASTTDTIEIR